MQKPEPFLEQFTHQCARWLGTSWAFMLALILIGMWIIPGFYMRFSTAWEQSFEMIISLIMFLILFITQRAQIKESLAIQVKLNELIAAMENADNKLINIENESEEKIETLHEFHESSK